MDFVGAAAVGLNVGTLGPGWVLWRDHLEEVYGGFLPAPWPPYTAMLVKSITSMRTGESLPDQVIAWEMLSSLVPLEGPPFAPPPMMRQHLGYGGGYVSPSYGQSGGYGGEAYYPQPPPKQITRGVDAATATATARATSRPPPQPPALPNQSRLSEEVGRLRFTMDGSPPLPPSPRPSLTTTDKAVPPPVSPAPLPLSIPLKAADASPVQPTPTPKEGKPRPRPKGERPAIGGESAALSAALAAAESALASLRREHDKLREERVCVICLDRPRETVIMPCAHLAVCKEDSCKRSMGWPLVCPICRGKVRCVRHSRFSLGCWPLCRMRHGAFVTPDSLWAAGPCVGCDMHGNAWVAEHGSTHHAFAVSHSHIEARLDRSTLQIFL